MVGVVSKQVLMTAGDGMTGRTPDSRSPHVVGVGGTGNVNTMGTAAGGKCLDNKRNKRCTYDRPGFLLCSFFLSRFGFLSSSVFFQCLLSFRLICLECKCQGVFL